MFKLNTYNYDAETDTGAVTFDSTLADLNGLKFASDQVVDGLSDDILGHIYSTQYTVVGIIDDWADSIQFVTAPIWVTQMQEKHNNG
jgi:hypothetical protein|tara:strand:+ start:64 stop:324 length:261 start_codon:yes stop_codon:yes gene_type:complete